MNRIIAIALFAILPLISFAQEEQEYTYEYIYKKDGTVMALPVELISRIDTVAGSVLKIYISDDTIINLSSRRIEKISFEEPEAPTLVSFGFKKKLNDQLPESKSKNGNKDVLEFNLPGIGKSLIPTYYIDSPAAHAYIDGQYVRSKITRVRFDGEQKLTIAYDGYEKLTNKLISPAVWSEEEWSVPVVDIPLTESMLSTNAPSNQGEDPGRMLDGNRDTYFHSTWGGGQYTPLPLDSCTYLDVTLNEAIKAFKFYYMGRGTTNYNPLAWNIYASNDGKNWKLFKQLTTADGLPTVSAYAEYTSDIIKLDGFYKYLRFEETAAEHKNYLVLSEFRLFSVANETGEPELIKPAELITPAKYAYRMEPFGKDFTLRVNWLTDSEETYVPKIYIDVDGGHDITDKTTFRHASFRIDGGGVFDDMEDSVWIRGRGNSSWGQSKKPYRLKFDEKVGPFGLTKGKSWVLLANAQSGSLLTNVFGHKIGRMVGTAGAMHTIPVDLYLNGSYKGNYNFIEKTGLSNNNIDIDELTGMMLELDEYYDEPYKFKSSPYNLPVVVKDPDLNEQPFVQRADFYFTQFKSTFNDFCAAVDGKKNYEDLIDIDAFCKYLLVNDLILNYEITHPKSSFLYKDHLSYSDSKIVFGPIWDLDWSYGYEDGSDYFKRSATVDLFRKNWTGSVFYKAVLNSSDKVKKHYYKVLTDFAEDYEELYQYIQDYYDFARESFQSNSELWEGGGGWGWGWGWGGSSGFDYEQQIKDMKTWFDSRVKYLLSSTKKYDLSDYVTSTLGDADNDGRVTAADIVQIACYMAGDEKAEFLFDQADADNDDEIGTADMQEVAELAMKPSVVPVLPTWRMAFSDLIISSYEFEVVEGQPSEAPITLSYLEGGSALDDDYVALQFDVILPTGLKILGAESETHTAIVSQPTQLDDQTVRQSVVLYSSSLTPFQLRSVVANLQVLAEEMLPSESQHIDLTNIRVVTPSCDIYRLNSVQIPFSQVTGINTIYAQYSIRGGETLQIEAAHPSNIKVYTPDGILFRTINAEQGKTQVNLPNGIYIVDGKKILIK